MKYLDWWFDFSCPYAYLSSTQVEALAKRCGAELRPQPMLLGGVFRALGTPQKLFETLIPQRAAHNGEDMLRYARDWGIALNMPAGHPFRTVQALRALLVVGPGEHFMPLVHAIYRAYWVDNEDISERAVLAKILQAQGFNADEVLDATQQQEIKDNLRARTERAVELGIFGAPSFVVTDTLFFGQDRMHQVERALGGQPAALPDASEFDGEVAPVDFYFDFSSPFAYVGHARVERMLGDRVRFKPMLLGAVFNAIGTPTVPLQTLNDSKRAYQPIDMARQTAEAGAPFTFASRFPVFSLLPLRVLLQVGANNAEGRRLTSRLFRGAWAEDLDMTDGEVVARLCDDVGLDGEALVAGAKDPKVKDQLRAVTEDAVKNGVFGAPTFIVHRPGKDPALYWGADRLDMATRAARGEEQLL